MPIPNTISDLSTTAASNSPAGSDPPTEGDNYLRAISAILKQTYVDLGTAGTAAVGAGLVGYNTAATYATATVGHWVRQGGEFLQSGTGAVARTVQNRLRETISAKDFGVTLDGTTDDTTAWGTLIAALPSSNFTLVIPPGTSIVNQSVVNGIKFDGKTNFSIFGHGATIKVDDSEAVTGNHEILYFNNCQDFYVEGLTVDGNRANRTPAEVGAHSIVIANSCARGTFKNVVSKNAVVDCWYVVTSGAAGTRPTDILLDSCVGDNGWRQGLSIINSIRLTVRGGRYVNTNGTNPESGIDIEPDAGTLTNDDTVIDGADLTGNAGYGIQIGGPEDLNTRVVLRNLTGSDNTLGFINASSVNDVTLQNITVGPHSGATRGVVDFGSLAKYIYADGIRFRGITAGSTKVCLFVHSDVVGRPVLRNISDVGSTSVVMTVQRSVAVNNFSSDGCTTDAVQLSAGTDTVIDGFDIRNCTGRAIYNAADDTKIRNGTVVDAASATASIQLDTGGTNVQVDNVTIVHTGAIPVGAVGVYCNAVPGRITNVHMRVNGADATVAQFATFAGGVSGAKIFDCVPHPLSTTATYDPASLTGPDVQTTTYTVTGAALGDLAFAAPGVDLNGMGYSVSVSAANTVRLTLMKVNSGTLDLGSSTWKFWVDKR